MKERVEKIKQHILKHKTVYACGATAVVVAGITVIIMRSTTKQHIGCGTSVAANRGISVIADRSVVTSSVSFVASRRQGAPSWVVRCIETGKVFTSQRAAAFAMELPESELSKHLNGAMDNVRGFTFERICIAG